MTKYLIYIKIIPEDVLLKKLILMESSSFLFIIKNMHIRLYIMILLFIVAGIYAKSQSLMIGGNDFQTNSFETKFSGSHGIYLNTSHFIALKDNNSTSNYMLLQFTGLKGDSIVNIALAEYSSPRQIILSENVRIPSSGILSIPQVFVANLSVHGSFFIEVFTPTYSYWERFDQQPIFIEKAITKTIPGTNQYKFLIHYEDNFIRNSPHVTPGDFVEDYVGDALLNSWQKQVTGWGLCNGLPGNIPENTDSTYDVYIHNVSDIIISKFNNQMSSSINDGQREIFVDYNPISYCNADTTQITEKELLYLVISHEFFHGIQFSHMSLDSIIKNSYPNHKQEINNRKWLIEGQAKFPSLSVASTLRTVNTGHILQLHHFNNKKNIKLTT